MRHLGYTRVSTSGQDAKLQLDALVAVGVQKRDVFADVTSGSKTAIERPGMKKLLAYVEPGDTVVVWRVDRLGRSLIDVLNTVNLLRERGSSAPAVPIAPIPPAIAPQNVDQALSQASNLSDLPIYNVRLRAAPRRPARVAGVAST